MTVITSEQCETSVQLEETFEWVNDIIWTASYEGANKQVTDPEIYNAQYQLETRDSGGWKVSRLDSHTNEIVSEENVAESLVSRTKKRLEKGETINFRDIDYTVAKETAVVYLLRDIINVDEEEKTYSLVRDSNDRKAFSSWEIIINFKF